MKTYIGLRQKIFHTGTKPLVLGTKPLLVKGTEDITFVACEEIRLHCEVNLTVPLTQDQVSVYWLKGDTLLNEVDHPMDFHSNNSVVIKTQYMFDGGWSVSGNYTCVVEVANYSTLSENFTTVVTSTLKKKPGKILIIHLKRASV